MYLVIIEFSVMTNAKKYNNARAQKDTCDAFREASETPEDITIYFNDLAIGDAQRAATDDEVASGHVWSTN